MLKTGSQCTTDRLKGTFWQLCQKIAKNGCQIDHRKSYFTEFCLVSCLQYFS